MKKILAFLTVLTAIFCTACDNKQDNINDNPPVGDITSAVSETDISEDKSENTKTTSNVSQDKGESKENSDIPDDSDDDSDSSAELKHYTVSDFNEIKVNLNVQETAPPVEFKEYDLSGIVFEAKKSPCTLPENVKIENICPISEASAQQMKMGYEEYCQQFLEFYEPILEAENKPLILYTAFDGENLYYLADYDIPCPRVSHNFEIFKYNPETGENTCIYEYSNGTEGITIVDLTYYDDSLWLLTLESEEIVTYRFDEASRKFNEDIFEKEIIIEALFSDVNLTNYKCTALISYSNESDIQLVKENRKVTAYTDTISLETGINKCTPALFTDKKMCFLQADSDVSILHTFDFEKMEKYTTNFGTADAKRTYQLGNNVLVHYVGSQKCIYFIPELGAGFVLQDIEKVSSPFGINYNATDTSVNVYGDKLAVANFDIGMYRDFYANNILLRDIYPPVEKDPLKKLYIFDTN